MYMSLKVLEAIAVLREAAENDFERHRLDVLMRDLTSPPTVEIVDDTHQKFDDVTYRETPEGHYKVNSFIHRQIFSYYHGEIPEGYEIHHADNNPANNDVHNLQMLTKSEHKKTHWQKSNSHAKKFICEFCGKEFFSTCACGTARFCSSKCRNDWHSTNDIGKIKTCVVCGNQFTPKKKSHASCCSRSCAMTFAWRNRRGYEKECPICGKKFMPPKGHPETMCCSKECKSKLIAQNRKNYFKALTNDNLT